MAYIKLTKELYKEESDVRQVLDYICDIIKCGHDVYGGCNIIAYNSYEPNLIAEQFLATQYRRNFIRRVYHLVISFDSVLDKVDLPLAYKVGMAVTNLYPDYQSVFAVHEDKSYLHIHIVFNNCAVFRDMRNLTAYFNFPLIIQIVDNMIDGHLGIPKSAYSVPYGS